MHTSRSAIANLQANLLGSSRALVEDARSADLIVCSRYLTG
jgi:hypothetical protein